MRDACSQKVSKNQKIVCAQVTQTKTGLSAVRTFSPLGIKKFQKIHKHFVFTLPCPKMQKAILVAFVF
jgi:hypothetical protein